MAIDRQTTVFVRGLTRREIAELDALANQARVTRGEAAGRLLRRMLRQARELAGVRHARELVDRPGRYAAGPSTAAVLPREVAAGEGSASRLRWIGGLWSCPRCGEWRMVCEDRCRCGFVRGTEGGVVRTGGGARDE